MKSLLMLVALVVVLPAAEADTDPLGALAEAKGAPLVLRFTADWCSWCHRMDAECQADAAARAALAAATVITIDADRFPDLMQRCQISGLPAMLLLDAKGRLVESVVGYRPPAEITAALARLAAGAEGSGAVLDLWPQRDWAAVPVADLFAALGVGSTAERMALRAVMSRRTDVDNSALWDGAADPTLGIRVDATAILHARLGGACPYDPFADRVTRRQQLDAWRQAAGVDEELP